MRSSGSNKEFVIKELIVVEGKNDAHAVRRALGHVDVIWTEGFGLTEEKLKYISEMAKRQGVIVCTDPDFVGNQIREKIGRRVPEVSHVYIPRISAYNKKGDDIGVENASVEDIREAFAKVLRSEAPKANNASPSDEAAREIDYVSIRDRESQTKGMIPVLEKEITMQDMVDNCLVGQTGSAEKRLALGRALGIGDTNAKQFLHRIKRFGISRDDFMEALRSIERKDE